MSTADPTGVRLMREHEVACERETGETEPMLTATLRDAVDCIIESAHAFEGLDNLEDDEQAVLAQIILGARTARVFVGLTLTGQYESALAVARMLIEDGIVCAYLVEFPEHAAKWRRLKIDLKYGEMADKVIEAHARRGEQESPGAAAAWRHAGAVLHAARKSLDVMSHANPARIQFVLKEHGYELYPFLDRGAFRVTTWFGLVGLVQMVSFTRKRLERHGKAVPPCNSDELHDRFAADLDELEKTDDPLGLHGA